MMHLKYAHSFEVVAELPAILKPLRKLAMNFRWTWHHPTRELFREVDRRLWDAVDHNPIELVNRLTEDRVRRLAEDRLFLERVEKCVSELDAYTNAKTWFDTKFPGEREKTTIAYFCAEFGISESMPIYSGGLGVLAGDHLKAASDLGLPLVGVGLLYARGYFRQLLNPDGWQQEFYPNYDFYNMPLQLMRGEDQQPIHVAVEFPDRTVTCQVWKAVVGRVPLYLLDSNVLENQPTDQGITDTLYGGDQEMRIRQEMILGIGGMRALQKLGIKPTVCHMNEGHAAFLTLERIKQFMQEYGCDFRTARQVLVSGNVFTTHTPVPAGFDVFQDDLLKRYLAKTTDAIGMSFTEFAKLGRIEPENVGEPFNMAILAMENANHINAVSKLHSTVSRGMFAARWPSYTIDEVPIDAITNGVHTMTWISKRVAELLDRHLSAGWREDPSSPDAWAEAAKIPNAEIWEMRENQRGDFVRHCRKHLHEYYTKRNAGTHDLAGISTVLDPRLLTVGFARRFTTYKRGTLLLNDKERLKSLLFHSERPVQFVFAGKSHPRDDGGKKMIQDLWQFLHADGVRTRIAFLEDYDMEIARSLVQGVDVWLNNPRRPMEASGTSGMKVVPNGGLNCSVLDGWWAEAYKPGLGWAIGDTQEQTDQGHQDWLDSRSLYHLLEQDIAPRFYNRTDSGIPTSWVEMIKASWRELAPRYSTARMVREYATRFYMPSSQSFRALAKPELKEAKDSLLWRDRVRASWPKVKIVRSQDSTGSVNPLGQEFEVRAWVQLGELSPDDVRVQVLSGKVGSNRELSQVDLHDLDLVGSEGESYLFKGDLKFDSTGHRGYVVRVVPAHKHIRIATELPLVTWEGN